MGSEAVVAIMDPRFRMGSMGSAVGEAGTDFSICDVFTDCRSSYSLPAVPHAGKGILSLMQMAKVSVAIERHNKAGLLYIAYDQSDDGVSRIRFQSAILILAETGALIGLPAAGSSKKRLRKTADDFQTAEFYSARAA